MHGSTDWLSHIHGGQFSHIDGKQIMIIEIIIGDTRNYSESIDTSSQKQHPCVQRIPYILTYLVF